MNSNRSAATATRRRVWDSARCVGCWMCVMVCPFDAIQRDLEIQVARKCDLCPDREIPACVTVCPTEALMLAER
ncbi:MAG: 4Fe-4S binding protein [Chloroflexi bacterium]|nr:4Fe-4S binding protein [Chloroflexota bacterium]